MASPKPNVIFVLGGPGAGMCLSIWYFVCFFGVIYSGKGTQCARIAEVCFVEDI
jgi:hypothetical protein